ncbi:homocysteine S-methyltransferase family protein [Paraburkholderia xenovorans]|uniref:homocysteine S-methyltransferase family protein n=1 Tax=Paraburkholderia xenovorans TaxID=36873 RepID=UPI0038B794DA
MSGFTLLDAGMRLALKQISAPFMPPRTTALALVEDPDLICRVHARSINAGVGIIRANSHEPLSKYVGEKRFGLNVDQLASLAGELARQAARNCARAIRVAGPLPVNARADYSARGSSKDRDRTLSLLVKGLSPYVDMWMAEHLANTEDLLGFELALRGDGKPRWASFGVRRHHDDELRATLQSGEAVEDAVIASLSSGVTAILLEGHCPDALACALTEARNVLRREDVDVPLGVLLRDFDPGAKTGGSRIRGTADCPSWDDRIDQWLPLGATLIGGYDGSTAEERTTSGRMRHKENSPCHF